MERPFGSLQKGHDAAAAGDTVWLRGGSYAVSKQVILSKSGQSDSKRIKFWAYQNETPLLDCSTYRSTDTGADVPAISVTGSWLHLKGLEIANVPTGSSGAHSISALRSRGASNNTYELLNIHHSFGPGLFLDGGNGGNLILNCDSHDNYDKNGSQGDGQNGDGFGVHYQMSGPSTIIRGCRAWLNSDDGYDFISQEVPVQVEHSWAIQNGYTNGGSTSPSSGNGNGFKAGSSKTGIRHILQNNLAWKNKEAGFYANHSSGGNTWYNNTAYKNKVQFNMRASPANATDQTIELTGAKRHIMRNNVGFPNANAYMGGVDSMSNTWDLNITESASFVSTDDGGFMGPRQADGSLPILDFLKPCMSSNLIDKGAEVGLPFAGAKPDLGAYEYGAATNGGSGGRNGDSGATGGSAGTPDSGTDGDPPGSGGSAGNGDAISGTGGNRTGSGGAAAAIGGSPTGGNSGTPDRGGAPGLNSGGTTSGGLACSMANSGPAKPFGGLTVPMASALLLLLSRRRRRGNQP
ncbi:MAG: right-handed parallel beta-helix repeat-containing protein [Myxococcales bacterium]